MHGHGKEQTNGVITYDELTHSKTLPFAGNINIIQSSEIYDEKATIPSVKCSKNEPKIHC